MEGGREGRREGGRDVPRGEHKYSGQTTVDSNSFQVSKHGIASSSLAVGGVHGQAADLGAVPEAGEGRREGG